MFVSMSVEKGCLIQEENQISYELMVATDNYNYIADEIANMPSDVDKESDAYKALLAEENNYDAQKTAYDAQLTVIKAQIDSYDKAVKDGIKSECKFSLSV